MKRLLFEKQAVGFGLYMKKFTIGKVAKAAGVGVETIRFYERKELIRQPPAFEGTYRCYPTETVARVCFIQRAKQLGLNFDEIRELLTLADSPNDDRRKSHVIAERNLVAVQTRLSDLERMRSALFEFSKSCRKRELIGEFPIVETLTSESD